MKKIFKVAMVMLLALTLAGAAVVTLRRKKIEE